MLRYREQVGLLPPSSEPGRHRQYDGDDLAAARFAAALEARYDVSPASLAFALRAVAEPTVGADLTRLGELSGRISPATRALDFDQVKAQRLLAPPPRPHGSRDASR
jgi:DNA-binding transcriptional MerR regulator